MARHHDLIINAVTMVADFLVPTIVQVVDAHPDIRIRYRASIDIQSMDGPSEDAASHTVIALRGGRRPPENDKDVRFLGLLSAGLFAVDPYIARFGKVRTPADLSSHRIVHRDVDRPTAPWDFWLAQLGDRMPRVIIRSSLEEVHRAAILSGQCAGFMPVSCMLHNPRLRTLMEPLDEWSAPLWMVSPRAEEMPATTARVCDELLDVLRRSLGGA